MYSRPQRHQTFRSMAWRTAVLGLSTPVAYSVVRNEPDTLPDFEKLTQSGLYAHSAEDEGEEGVSLIAPTHADVSLTSASGTLRMKSQSVSRRRCENVRCYTQNDEFRPKK